MTEEFVDDQDMHENMQYVEECDQQEATNLNSDNFEVSACQFSSFAFVFVD